MLPRNNGKGEVNVLQNQFTAYLLTAIHRKKDAVLRKRRRVSRYEESVDFQSIPPEDQMVYVQKFPLEEAFENAALEMVLEQLSPRDRYIFLARVLDKRSYEELGEEFGLGYQGAAAVYHRVIKKIRNAMGEEAK